MKKEFVVYTAVLVAVLLVAAGWVYESAPLWRPLATAQSGRVIYIHNAPIQVDVADTVDLRERGLGGRGSLAPDTGMLFVFPVDGNYAFWMKDMGFSIDIMWIGNDGRIVFIKQSVSPDTYPQAFAPNAPTRYVLELPAGYSAQHDVKTGDTVQF